MLVSHALCKKERERKKERTKSPRNYKFLLLLFNCSVILSAVPWCDSLSMYGLHRIHLRRITLTSVAWNVGIPPTWILLQCHALISEMAATISPALFIGTLKYWEGVGYSLLGKAPVRYSPWGLKTQWHHALLVRYLWLCRMPEATSS